MISRSSCAGTTTTSHRQQRGKSRPGEGAAGEPALPERQGDHPRADLRDGQRPHRRIARDGMPAGAHRPRREGHRLRQRRRRQRGRRAPGGGLSRRQRPPPHRPAARRSRIFTAQERLPATASACGAWDRARQSLVGVSRSTVEHAIDATIRLFSRADRPTALFTVDSLMTQGALLGLRSMGLSIPQDVSLVGFDDFDLATFTDPQITVVAQPTRRWGRSPPASCSSASPAIAASRAMSASAHASSSAARLRQWATIVASTGSERNADCPGDGRPGSGKPPRVQPVRIAGSPIGLAVLPQPPRPEPSWSVADAILPQLGLLPSPLELSAGAPFHHLPAPLALAPEKPQPEPPRRKISSLR